MYPHVILYQATRQHPTLRRMNRSISLYIVEENTDGKKTILRVPSHETNRSYCAISSKPKKPATSKAWELALQWRFNPQTAAAVNTWLPTCWCRWKNSSQWNGELKRFTDFTDHDPVMTFGDLRSFHRLRAFCDEGATSPRRSHCRCHDLGFNLRHYKEFSTRSKLVKELKILIYILTKV